MKKFYIIVLVFLSATPGIFAAGPDADEILAEGLMLFRLEKASWYATDDFVTTHQPLTSEVGGYVSYLAGDGKINTVFYHKDNPDSVLARYQFADLPRKTFVMLDEVDAPGRTLERELIAVREDALEVLVENADDFFTFYPSTAINFVPVTSGRDKKVYILTAPTTRGKVLLGGDYVLTYNSRGRRKSREKIHNNLIELQARSDDPAAPMAATMHNHVISDAITPTDICTLMLYKDFVEWNKHIVVGKEYVSVFDMDDQTLEILTADQWKEFNGSEPAASE